MTDGEIKGKYTAAEAKAFSAEQRQTLSLRTLDLVEITVPEKEPLPKTAPTALAVSDVRYTYGRKAGDTLSGVSFSVREHEIVGLVGANGCGKTTIGKLIAGLYRPLRRQDNAFRKAAKSKAAAKASAVHPSGGGVPVLHQLRPARTAIRPCGDTGV